MYKKRAVILSGGLGMRLRPFTEVIPKALLPIGEKAVLEIQIEQLKKHGFEEVYLATNYKSEYIENFFGDGSRYGLKLFVSKEDKPLGTAGPVRLLRERLADAPFVLMNGDVITSLNFTQFFDFAESSDSLLTTAIKRIITPYEFGKITFEGDRILNIEEKADFITYALAGIYVMKPAAIDLIPPDEYFGMDKLILKMLSLNMPIFKYEIKDYWLDIGRVHDYETINAAYQELQKDAEEDE